MSREIRNRRKKPLIDRSYYRILPFLSVERQAFPTPSCIRQCIVHFKDHSGYNYGLTKSGRVKFCCRDGHREASLFLTRVAKGRFRVYKKLKRFIQRPGVRFYAVEVGYAGDTVQAGKFINKFNDIVILRKDGTLFPSIPLAGEFMEIIYEYFSREELEIIAKDVADEQQT